MPMAQTTPRARFPRRFFASLTALLRPRRRPRFDPRDLPDHLKRDIGYLDGRTDPARISDFASDRWKGPVADR